MHCNQERLVWDERSRTSREDLQISTEVRVEIWLTSIDFNSGESKIYNLCKDGRSFNSIFSL